MKYSSKFQDMCALYDSQASVICISITSYIHYLFVMKTVRKLPSCRQGSTFLVISASEG